MMVSAAVITQEWSFSASDITVTSHGEYDIVELTDGMIEAAAPGMPALPVKAAKVLLPAGYSCADIDIETETELLKENSTVFPQQRVVRPGMTSTFAVPDSDVYSQSAPYPSSAATVSKVHFATGYPFVDIKVRPVLYIPGEKQLLRVAHVRVILHLVKADTISLLRDTVASRTLLKDIANPSVIRTYSAPEVRAAALRTAEETIDYLIITKANSLTSAFAQLAQHRRDISGLSTAIVTVEDIVATYSGSDTQEKIRNCIKKYVYSNSTSYVVLGGDDTIVPDRDCYVSVNGGAEVESHMPTDLYYSGLEGTWDEDGDGTYGEADTSAGDEGDLTADVIVGRIPVRNSGQAFAYINKLITYENAPPAASFTRRFFMGGVELWDSYTGSSRPSDSMNDGHKQFSEHSPVTDAEMWMRRLHRGGVQPYWSANELGYLFDSLSSWDGATAGSYAASATHLVDQFNNGWYHVFMGTHGFNTMWSAEGGGFYTSHATSLTTVIPVIYTMACLTAYFDGSSDPCLSEAFLRNANGGALAYLGCSRYGWGYPDSPPASNYSDGGTSLDYAYEFYEEVFNGNHDRLGDAFAAHKEALRGQCGYNGAYRWVQFGLNYQGDPAMPTVIAETRPAIALVHSTDSGDDTFNEPGETVSTTLTILNNGLAPLDSLTCTLESTTSWLSVQSPVSRSLGTIASGDEASNAVPYLVEIATNAPAATVEMPVYLTANGNTWTDSVSLTVTRLPKWSSTATSLWLEAGSTGEDSSSFVIQNDGIATLSYTIMDNLPINITNYSWSDSNTPGGPTYSWYDTSASCTEISLGDDDYKGPYTLDFEFPFFDATYDTYWIAANGGIRFTAGNVWRDNRELPCDISTYVDGPFIAGLWDDLNPAASGAKVTYRSTMDALIVSFIDVPLSGESDGMTFQIICKRDGTIVCAYQDVNGTSDTSTIGIQEDNAPARGVQVAFDTAYAQDNLLLQFTPERAENWITYAPNDGSIAPGDETPVDITCNSDGLTEGVYTAHVAFVHNDPLAGSSEIDVYFVVPEPAFALGLFSIALVLVRRKINT